VSDTNPGQNSRVVSEYMRAEFSRRPGIQLVEDSSIEIPSVVDKHGLETKTCLEC
jgi:hypothetical protein